MKRKKQFLILSIVLFVFVAAGAGVLAWVGARYYNTGLARFDTRDARYVWNGKLLLSEDGKTALVYRDAERVPLEELERQDVNLTPYGFEGESFSYFLYNGLALSVEEGYEGFWPVSTPRRFLYRSGDGVYQIDTEQGRAWPVFADSVAGVPENGEGLLAFSSNGSYALSLDKGVATVYHTDPENDSLRIVDVKTVDLNALGTDACFVAFTSEQHAVFTLTADKQTAYAAVDCRTGEALICPADYSVKRGEVLSRFFAQRPLSEEEETKYCAAWTNLLLGTDTLCKGTEPDMKLLSVSPSGGHGAARQNDRIWILSPGRLFCLSDVLEGERVDAVDFMEENVIAVSVVRDGAPMTYFYTVLF